MDIKSQMIQYYDAENNFPIQNSLYTHSIRTCQIMRKKNPFMLYKLKFLF
uniref:Uncharacterized protein n=1 Tax=Lepeophtheirus salmonis TaxID=72036 RepID=A0A0K2T148_LEPSM